MQLTKPKLNYARSDTKAELLVSVMATLPASGFSESDLTVRAWALYPRTFGLRGYEGQYPDHKRVATALLDRAGPVVAGLAERVAPGRYRLTEAGRQYARPRLVPRRAAS